MVPYVDEPYRYIMKKILKDHSAKINFGSEHCFTAQSSSENSIQRFTASQAQY